MLLPLGFTAALSAALLTGTPNVTQELQLPDGRTVRFETAAGPAGESLRHGDFRVLDASDEWVIRGEYEQGTRAGSWFYRHRSGEKLASGKYRDGERHGRWKFYFRSGELCAEGVFKKGVLSGKWEFFRLGGSAKDSETVEVVPVAGAAEEHGLTYAGFLAPRGPVGTWRIVREDGSLLFEGSFDLTGQMRAGSFRHLGGIEDSSFFLAAEAVGHPLDYAFMEPDEYGALTLRGGPAVRAEPLTLKEAVSSIRTAPLVRNAVPAPLVESSKRPRKRRSIPGGRVRPLDTRSAEKVQAATCGALKTLAGVDWDEDKKALRSAQKLASEVLEPGLGFPPPDSYPLGFDFDRASGSPEGRRLALLRAYSLLEIHHGDVDFWSVDACLGVTWPAAADSVSPTDDFDVRRILRAADQKVLAGMMKGGGKASRGRAKKRDKDAERIDRVIQDGLSWLVRQQLPDGSWKPGLEQAPAGMDPTILNAGQGHTVGVTALALLALVRDAQTPESEVRMTALRRGIRYILDHRGQEHGALAEFGAHAIWIYDHATALQVLSESLALVSTARMRRAIPDAIGVLERARNPYAVWRYGVLPNGENDTSATFWTLRALRAAEAAGFVIKDDHGKNVLGFLDVVTEPGSGRVGYVEAGTQSARIPGINQHMSAEGTETLTAEGVALRHWFGGEDPKGWEDGADLILMSLPSEVRVDYGYWLAGSEAMAAIGGKRGAAWAESLRSVLSATQEKVSSQAGSWPTTGPWCPMGGRPYATAMAVLALQTVQR